ncbi:MAG TPA: OsmC family protein [Cellvibrio sp.]|nr:OsmC family protein [Cellvibrio sp.]
MADLPHLYRVVSKGSLEGNLIAQAENLPDLTVTSPAQFGGPGNEWSPEDLLMASVSNCLILSFRAIARFSKLDWVSIECVSEGVLDKVERKLQFTKVVSKVKLFIPATETKEKAEKLLDKAEETCLISNSLSCESFIEYEVVFL